MVKDMSNRKDTGKKDEWGRPIYNWDNNADKIADKNIINNNPGKDFDNNSSYHDIEGDKKAFKYLLENGDIEEIVDDIEDLETSEDVSYHYDTMKKATSRRVNSSDGEKIIIAYASNENTPEKVLKDLHKVGNKYHDLYNGISSSAATALRDNPNASQELKDNINNKLEKYKEADKKLEKQNKEDENARKAFEKDPELKSRLEKVREQNVRGGSRRMDFDPQDVEKAGVGYVARNYVHLFGSTYNENTGSFTGYTD